MIMRVLRLLFFAFAGTGCTVFGIVLLLVLLNARTPARTDPDRSPQRASPPASLSAPVSLKVVTFNICDLYWQSQEHAARSFAIAERLAALNADVIGLQESFIRKDREHIFRVLAAAGLPYHHYFRSGLVGSGLSVISRFPIEEAHFFRYSQGGKAYKPYHGDWWAGKGVCLTRLRLPGDDAGYIDFFNTHAHARYNNDSYEEVRMSQAGELADYIRRAATGTSPALVVGDFNTSAGQPQYQTLVERAGLDRLMLLDSRIDHIFAVRNPRYTFETLATIPIEAEGRSKRLSDHTGYMSTLRITPVEMP